MLATVSELKQYLWIHDNSQDFVLWLFLRWANQIILTHINRDIIKEDYQTTFNGNGQKYVMLKNYPINEIYSLEINNGKLDEQEWEEIDPSKYTFESKTGKVMLLFNLFRWFNNYRITYNAGYEQVPADLQMATLKLAAKYYNNRSSDGIKWETVNGDRLDYEVSEIPSDIMVVLSSYRDHEF